jgi:DNA-binding LacI/PurR family transcriptional regulator
LPSELKGGRIATTAALDAGHRRLAFIRNTETDPVRRSTLGPPPGQA